MGIPQASARSGPARETLILYFLSFFCLDAGAKTDRLWPSVCLPMTQRQKCVRAMVCVCVCCVEWQWQRNKAREIEKERNTELERNRQAGPRQRECSRYFCLQNKVRVHHCYWWTTLVSNSNQRQIMQIDRQCCYFARSSPRNALNCCELYQRL